MLSHMQQCSHFSPAQWANKIQHVPRFGAGEIPGKPAGLKGLIPSESLGLQCVIYMRSSRSCIHRTSLMKCGIISLLITGFSGQGGRFGAGWITASQRLCPEFLRQEWAVRVGDGQHGQDQAWLWVSHIARWKQTESSGVFPELALGLGTQGVLSAHWAGSEFVHSGSSGCSLSWVCALREFWHWPGSGFVHLESSGCSLSWLWVCAHMEFWHWAGSGSVHTGREGVQGMLWGQSLQPQAGLIPSLTLSSCDILGHHLISRL